MKNKTKEWTGIGVLVLGFLMFLITPINFTGRAVGGNATFTNSYFSIIGLIVMAVGIGFLMTRE